MVMGRPSRPYAVDRITVAPHVWIHRIMRYLNVPETAVYEAGALKIMEERASELTPEHIEQVIQDERRKMKETQDEIARLERLLMDTSIRNEIISEKEQVTKKIEIRQDARGRDYQAVIVE
jgi:hypothetical protein